MEKITYTNHIRIGDKKICLNEIPEGEREALANCMIYRSLMAIPNVEVIQTA